MNRRFLNSTYVSENVNQLVLKNKLLSKRQALSLVLVWCGGGVGWECVVISSKQSSKLLPG